MILADTQVKPDGGPDAFFCVTAPKDRTIPRYCTPQSQSAVDRFRLFKTTLNRAAAQLALGQYVLDTADPNLDEQTFNMMVLIARRIVYDKRRGTPILVLAAMGPSNEVVGEIASRLTEAEIAYAAVARGEYGKPDDYATPAVVQKAPPIGGIIMLAAGGLAVVGFGALLLRSR